MEKASKISESVNKVVFRQAFLPNELTWINEQYASIHFVLSLESDFIVVAEVDGVKAGLGRLVPIGNSTAELGGIYVFPEFRGTAIATGIVNYLLKNNPYPSLFCVPFAHLSEFYQRFGFAPINSTVSVPQKITDKLAWCACAYTTPSVLLYRS